MASAGAEQSGQAQRGTCMNCGATLYGPFCAQCGQKDSDLRRPFWTFTVEFAENLFTFDSRAARTLGSLFGTPGRMSRRYVEGQRARFVPPVRMMLIAVLVFFLTLEATEVAIVHFKAQELSQSQQALVEMQMEAPPGEQDVQAAADRKAVTLGFFVPVKEAVTDPLIPDEEVAELEREIQADGEQEAQIKGFVKRVLQGVNLAARRPQLVNDVFNKWLPRAMLLLIPVFALMLRAVHWRRGSYLFNQLVFSLHYHSFLFMLLTAAVLLAAAGAAAAAAPLVLVGAPLYLLVGMKLFYRQGWVRTVLKFLLVGFVYLLVLTIALSSILMWGLAEL